MFSLLLTFEQTLVHHKRCHWIICCRPGSLCSAARPKPLPRPAWLKYLDKKKIAFPKIPPTFVCSAVLICRELTFTVFVFTAWINNSQTRNLESRQVWFRGNHLTSVNVWIRGSKRKRWYCQNVEQGVSTAGTLGRRRSVRGDALIVEVSVCVKPEAGEGNCRHTATSCLCCRPERSVKVPPVGGDAVQFRQRVN